MKFLLHRNKTGNKIKVSKTSCHMHVFTRTQHTPTLTHTATQQTRNATDTHSSAFQFLRTGKTRTELLFKLCPTTDTHQIRCVSSQTGSISTHILVINGLSIFHPALQISLSVPVGPISLEKQIENYKN